MPKRDMAIPVVPLPKNGSTTFDLGERSLAHHSMIFMGLTVGCLLAITPSFSGVNPASLSERLALGV